ncbi:hypothetical protein T265_06338 [Opisthorchis viverrini]|uniref:Uncharacterized protein n=1 Tax=Opisthorchis viverrini TaxID=6198 RepID=A0A075AE06_OPIVI|nr:hypothetical protein T265_06338 [Opisthorchis viverrini]KER26424.1 hypothetical protein T265_06338 [Opisthorchis viverrini]
MDTSEILFYLPPHYAFVRRPPNVAENELRMRSAVKTIQMPSLGNQLRFANYDTTECCITVLSNDPLFRNAILKSSQNYPAVSA